MSGPSPPLLSVLIAECRLHTRNPGASGGDCLTSSPAPSDGHPPNPGSRDARDSRLVFLEMPDRAGTQAGIRCCGYKGSQHHLLSPEISRAASKDYRLPDARGARRCRLHTQDPSDPRAIARSGAGPPSSSRVRPSLACYGIAPQYPPDLKRLTIAGNFAALRARRQFLDRGKR